ncbi:MAG: hypothetical protein ACYCO3_13630 [Mycobacteriales bacterium]
MRSHPVPGRPALAAATLGLLACGGAAALLGLGLTSLAGSTGPVASGAPGSSLPAGAVPGVVVVPAPPASSPTGPRATARPGARNRARQTTVALAPLSILATMPGLANGTGQTSGPTRQVIAASVSHVAGSIAGSVAVAAPALALPSATAAPAASAPPAPAANARPRQGSRPTVQVSEMGSNLPRPSSADRPGSAPAGQARPQRQPRKRHRSKERHGAGGHAGRSQRRKDRPSRPRQDVRRKQH